MAEKYGRSAAALSRHWQLHMRVQPAVVAIPAAAQPAEAGSAVVEQVRELREAARQIRVREELRATGRGGEGDRARAAEPGAGAADAGEAGGAGWLADPKTAEFLRLVIKMLERHPETLEAFREELKKLEGEEAA